MIQCALTNASKCISRKVTRWRPRAMESGGKAAMPKVLRCREAVHLAVR